ncbi:hypothetical protein FE784_24370 [Paenibacillus hemerocallicola]|uniref:TreTu toxin C-terminal domain-containing protein n=1 Tax=Paenibacillus hemerocallicola TaxID=1172614 RepID=A0A5C4T5J8_9BACL|nr:hypothetical protein [Paenibacillus hemerocallicola]TNJ63597.1 hypothetical protein FE784_24370 [Paenibacillus hemerocallicola]
MKDAAVDMLTDVRDNALTYAGIYYAEVKALALPIEEAAIGAVAAATKFSGKLANFASKAMKLFKKADEAVEGMGNAVNSTRVGQWMSKAEYNEFVKTGTIPRTNVLTKGKQGFEKQANTGDYYVEFDIDSSLLMEKDVDLGWSLVKSKNQTQLKLAEKKGQTLPDPIGTNINHVDTK